MNRFLPLIFAGLVPAGPALAAGPTPTVTETMVMPAAIPPVASRGTDWTGAYVGVQLGYGTHDFTTDLDSYDSDGIIGGIHAGYLWDFGDWVVGPEFQWDTTDLDIDEPEGSGTFDQLARLNLRAGRDLGRGLAYGSVGMAWASFDGDTGILSGNLDDTGYTLGLGYDYLLTDRWVLGGQYQYHRFNDFGAAGNDVDFSTVHLRASYRF